MEPLTLQDYYWKEVLSELVVESCSRYMNKLESEIRRLDEYNKRLVGGGWEGMDPKPEMDPETELFEIYYNHYRPATEYRRQIKKR